MSNETTFTVTNPNGVALGGVIEWGETVDVVRYRHPMTGSLCENPLQGWADPPGVDTGHAAIARLFEAVEGADTFCDDCAGMEHANWRLEAGGRLRLETG